jgi:hypothetical protein
MVDDFTEGGGGGNRTENGGGGIGGVVDDFTEGGGGGNRTESGGGGVGADDGFCGVCCTVADFLPSVFVSKLGDGTTSCGAVGCTSVKLFAF